MMAKRSKTQKPDPDGFVRSGIYQRYAGKRSVGDPQTAEEQIAILRQLADPADADLEAWLQQHVGWAASIIKPHVTGPLEKSTAENGATYKMADLGSGWRFYSPKQDAPEVVFDAFNLMVQVRIAKTHTGACGRQVALAAAVYKIGRLHERILVRHFEPMVKSEKGRRDSAKRSAQGINECYTQLHPEYQPRVDALTAEGNSYTRATEIAAGEFRVTPRTIQNHTINKSPQHGRRHNKAE